MTYGIEGQCPTSEPYWSFAEHFFVRSIYPQGQMSFSCARVFTLGRNAPLLSLSSLCPETPVPLGSLLPTFREEDSCEV